VDHKHGNCKLELIHRDFLRKLLGVNDTTPNVAVLGEFGRLPLHFRWWKQTLNFWHRLESSHGKLIHGAYLENKILHRVHGAGWYTSLINWVRVNSDYTGEEIDVRKIMKEATTMYTNSRRDQREGTKHVF
jgi:hypothetical protein